MGDSGDASKLRQRLNDPVGFHAFVRSELVDTVRPGDLHRLPSPGSWRGEILPRVVRDIGQRCARLAEQLLDMFKGARVRLPAFPSPYVSADAQMNTARI